MPPEATASTPASGAAASAASNEELKGILYPKPGAAVAEAAPEAEHDPEFDDDPKDPKADPDADPEADPDADPEPKPKKKAAAADPKADPDEDPEADPEADPDAEEDPDEDPDPEADEKSLREKANFTPGQQKVVDKLLGKMTEQNRALRTKAEKLEGQNKALGEEVDTLRAGLPAPVSTQSNPLADVTAEGDLATRERNAMNLRQWLVRNRDGGDLPNSDGKGGTVKISPERRDELLAETDELLMMHVPARRAFIADRRAFDAEARRIFPDLKDSKSELSLRVDAALRHYAALQSMPEARLFIADALANRAARTKAAGAREVTPARRPNGEPQPRKAPRTEGAPRVAARADPNRKRADQAGERLAKTGQDDGNVALAQLIGGPGR